MRLELGWSEVVALAAGAATRLAGRRLEVDLAALRALLAAAARLTGVRLDLANPGESCRIDVWHGSPADRLHDRRLFERTGERWTFETLVP